MWKLEIKNAKRPRPKLGVDCKAKKSLHPIVAYQYVGTMYAQLNVHRGTGTVCRYGIIHIEGNERKCKQMANHR